MKDFIKLVKLRLTLLVVFSASISFVIGSKVNGPIDWSSHEFWSNWLMLIVGGFLVTSAANGFNEIIEKDLDRLMTRTSDRPLPSGRMTNGQALVLSLLMAIVGTYLLGKLNPTTGFLSIFSVILYAFAYTPLKRKSPIAVFVGAIPGALPPLIGYVAAHPKIDEIALILFAIQFVWQFPHFWAIAWVLDDDYKLAGFRLLPSGKRDSTSAIITFVTTLALLPVSLLPYLNHNAGIVLAIVSLLMSLIFIYQAFNLMRTREISSARKLMFGSFYYLPVVQLMFLFDFIGK
ncbi:protoheme IX farnesyltransferase [Mucilaginibacter terrigena]|uniref:Protoheme IX farnesyltransferase n=1 Tax=Mucilaginibacter terrigena TaxID=2492395 RepID=A0A4Q5LJY5_9SPHI|nr:heme o synthase [Mucilaginibacter terrigena]RYU87325.1 protoheme IX farnesyltransferase [Mucilaginibacter terrigena]